MPQNPSPETRARHARSQRAWTLLAAPDLSKFGLLAAIAREAGVSSATMSPMKDRLTRLRAEGTKQCGRWERDGAGRHTPGECVALARAGEERWAAYLAAKAKAKAERAAAGETPKEPASADQRRRLLLSVMRPAKTGS